MEVSRLAFQLWRRAGYPEGRYIEFWQKASKQLIEGVAGEAPPERPPEKKGARPLE